MNKDNFFLGIIAGLIVPLFGIFFLYEIKFAADNVSMQDAIYLLKENKSNIPKVLSLGMLACIPLITFYKNRKRFTTLKGIFVSILFYALIAVLYKFNVL